LKQVIRTSVAGGCFTLNSKPRAFSTKRAGFVTRETVVLPDTAGGPVPIARCAKAAAAGQSFCFPRCFSAEGVIPSMTLQEVLSLLTLIGGAVYGTFQIVWTITHDNKKRK
ncbi:hypothetical protein, partial [Allofournierella massiliensis]|uniref:hypothetical protein n=1 Tax=Allofournierella massiliensis TaxID=1650663 RepID=UPI0024B101DC